MSAASLRRRYALGAQERRRREHRIAVARIIDANDAEAAQGPHPNLGPSMTQLLDGSRSWANGVTPYCSVLTDLARFRECEPEGFETMRILFINPNITSAITELMAAEARRSAAVGTELVPVTAEFGTLYVENRVEATIAAHAVLDACAAHSDGCDAVIISAFGDPGLYAA